MSEEHWWKDIDNENRSTRRKTCSSASLSTTNLTRAGNRVTYTANIILNTKNKLLLLR
jgi:hypothetical protein